MYIEIQTKDNFFIKNVKLHKIKLFFAEEWKVF